MASSISKYYRVTTILIRNCFSKETAYRLPFFIWVIANLLWLGFSFFSIDLLFRQVPVIAGWGIAEARLLVMVHALFLTTIWIFIMPNLVVFWRLINQGTLDFYLIKPISARYLSSATLYKFDMIPRLIPIAIVAFSLLGALPRQITFSEIGVFTLVILLGMVIFYNFGFIVVTTCFWFTKIDALEDFFNVSLDMGKYPSDIYKGFSRPFFAYLIPSIFVAVMPTLVLLGKGKWGILVVCLLAAAVSTLVSHWFWSFALKHYSSASS